MSDHAEPLPHGPTPRERKRLSQQALEILQLFRVGEGRVTNTQMAAVALKYSARVTELRHAGHMIVVEERDRKTGRVVYRYDGRSDASVARMDTVAIGAKTQQLIRDYRAKHPEVAVMQVIFLAMKVLMKQEGGS